jgi:hypothetical protein
MRTVLTSPVAVAELACRAHSQQATPALSSIVQIGTIW